MKKLTIILWLLFPTIAIGQTTTENFVKTTAYKIPTLTSIPSPTASQAVQSVIYFDGLGRPKQKNQVKQSASGNDLITLVEYDAFGRQVKEYLPFASTQNTSNYVSQGSLKSDLILQYQAKYGTANNNPYSEKLLEASPLNRLFQQAFPGNSWSLNNPEKHTIKLDYQTNSAADQVKLYTADAVWNSTSALNDTPLGNASGAVFYTSGQLYKTITYDENSSAVPLTETEGSTVEFKNKEGQVILKRTYGVVGEGSSNEKHDTYYVYNNFGNLAYVIPPKADGIITESVLNNLCYQYKYDSSGRLSEKKLPGKQWEYLIYDNRDRLVATGPVFSPFNDTSIGSQGWSITKYDSFDRPILTGWLPVSGTITTQLRKALQNDQNALTGNLSEVKLAGNSNTTIPSGNGVKFRYSNVVWPIIGYEVLTVNYFDDYSFPDSPSTIPSVVDTQPVYYNNTLKPKGLPTANWTRVLEGSSSYNNDLSYVFYDEKARPLQNYYKNFLGGSTTVENRYDFESKILRTSTYHKRLNGDNIIPTIELFDYYDQGRLKTHTSQTAGGTVELLSENAYDAFGRLNTKSTGNNILSPTQKVNYNFNIRGWLTDINNVNSLSQGTDPKDLFAFKISYDLPASGIPLFNGNISQTSWATESPDNQIKTYTYGYDRLNRLKSAVDNLSLFYEKDIAYDKNGNIIKLNRKGPIVPLPSIAVPGNYGQMDNLTYFYDDGNRLQTVSDLGDDNYGFNDNVTGPGVVDTGIDYTYDANGNMLTDANKGISSNIAYNHLNLPTKIIFPTGNITYIYNAAGRKVQKKVSTAGLPDAVTDYINGYQYYNGVLKFFPTSEGFVEYMGGSYKYIFQYKDHLGNVRLSYDKNALIQEENNYYPFGLKHKGYNGSSLSTNDGLKYKYNGKELQEELGLNMYDYGARNYDPTLGRWMNLDPLAEISHKLSPYNYVKNNPLNLTDPSGMIWKDQKEADDLKEEITSTKESISKAIAKDRQRLLKEGISDSKKDRINKRISDSQSRLKSLDKTLSNIDALGNDKKHTFDLVSGNDGKNHVTKGENGVINIQGPNSALQIHELTHVALSLSTPKGMTFNTDGLLLANSKDGLIDEIFGYASQYAFSPSSLPAFANSMNEIDLVFLASIQDENNAPVYKALYNQYKEQIKARKEEQKREGTEQKLEKENE